MSIKGTDNKGVEWTGEVELSVDDYGKVSGTIVWRSSKSYHGTETVEGTLVGSDLKLKGTSVTGSIVRCSYSGTWEAGQINLNWTGRCPNGQVSGPARLILTTQLK